MAGEILALREGVPRTCQIISAGIGGRIAQRMGPPRPRLPSRPERHGDPRRRRQSADRDRSEASLVDWRLRGFRSVHSDSAYINGRFREPARRGRQPARIDRRRLELRGTQFALWSSRACDGINREWVGGARRHYSLHRDVSYFLRLHAAADAARGVDGGEGGLWFFPRKARFWPGWSNASTDRATSLAASDPKLDCDSPVRCERNSRGMAHSN